MFIFEMPIHAASAATNTDFQQMSAQLAFCHLSQVALQKIFPDKTFFADILEIFSFVIFIVIISNLESRGKIFLWNSKIVGPLRFREFWLNREILVLSGIRIFSREIEAEDIYRMQNRCVFTNFNSG